MLKKYVFALAASAAVFSFQACKKGGGKETTATGLEYEFHEDVKGDTAKFGDVLTLHLILKTSKDSVLRDTYKEGEPLQMPLQKPSFKGAPEEGFKLMSEGDSATFYVLSDSLFQGNNPAFVPKGSKLNFTVKVLKIQSMEQAKADYEAKMKKQQEEAVVTEQKYIAIDDSLISAYAKQNNLNVKKTESGLQYIVTKEGTGPIPASGDTVSVHYTGKLLDGKVFDSSVERGEPIKFPLGQGNVIPGWDEGIANLKEGSKATLLVPSRLAYRSTGAGGVIPPNSVLLFDVELVKVKK